MSMLPDEKATPLSSTVDPVEPWSTSSSVRGAGPPSYPPTEVRRWLICPVFRDYSARWELRLEEWTPNRLVGTAIHTGIAAWLHSRVVSSTCPAIQADEAGNVAQATLKAGYVQQETWGLAGLEALVIKGTNALIKSVTAALLPGATILGVETCIESGGRHRVLDLTLQRGNTLEIWDWKVSLNLSDTYLPDRLLEAHHSWQLLDYAWHGQRHFQVPVSRVGHGLVILGPTRKIEYSPVTVTQERLAQWHRDAECIWQMIWIHARAPGSQFLPELSPWHNWKACTDKHLHYGKQCQFFEACHTYFDNERLFPALYRPVR